MKLSTSNDLLYTVITFLLLVCEELTCITSQIKKKDVNKEFQEYDKKKDPYYIDYKLLTMISKSHITVTKSDYARNCQLLVKGIKPPLQVDLCIEHHNNLTIDGIIESRSSNRKGGPVEVLGSGMYVAMYIAGNVVCTQV